ncbi:hypothetical protein M5689_023513 [Euphorbia peplus]|nr:hypothetical protein M5689_023513 [Euphorbia peplus]
MAFYLIRASSSIFPSSVRSLSGVFSCFRNVDQILSVCRFCTTTDDKIVDILESDCTAWKPSNIHVPPEFPFEFEENKQYILEEYMKYQFRRKYQDEIIEVAANGFELIDGYEPCIQVNARVIRATEHLLFQMTAYDREQMDIHTLVITPAYSSGHLNTFQNYLEIRGFNEGMMDFLFNCYTKPFPNNDMVPDGFSVEVKGRVNQRVISLRRLFENEMIEVELHDRIASSYIPSNGHALFDLVLNIAKGDVHITFDIEVFPCQAYPFKVHAMYMRHRYGGHMMDFEKFWEPRGIKPSTSSFMFDFFDKIDELKDCRSLGAN